jgi:diguanylate cyclase (GGDEF)-like protein
MGAFAIVQMFERTRSTSGVQRVAWAFLTAIASGATIWCTHFVAMLAFRAGVPVTLDPVLTIASLGIAIAGTFGGISLATWGERARYGLAGGAVFGAAISSMHYTGMAAYRVDGIVTWDRAYVAASIISSILFSAAAFAALQRDAWARHRLAGTTLIVTAIASLHFVAMTAMQIAPLSLSEHPLQPEDWRTLAVATAFVGAMVIVAGVFAALIDRETRSETSQKLAFMALNDALTALPNRAAFSAELARRINMAGSQVALTVINLHRFKEINDRHGHRVGDQVLAAFAGHLRAAAGNAFVGRIGGDEFTILADCSDDHALTEFVDRLEKAFKSPVRAGSFEGRLAASIGVAVYPRDAQTAETLASNAELALHRGRRDGASGPCYYDAALDQSVRDRRELMADLAGAIERNELDIDYQVQARASTGEITGFEALLRWKHPKRGLVPPSVFIPLAEENGLILELGEWVLRRACRDAAGWDHGSKVAINVSAVQLARTDLPALIREVMIETGLSPRRLEIELTETAIMEQRERALHVLRQVKALGIGVALDDFGTGYSSLETLRSFRFDKIKLDRFFTAELEDNPQSTAIVRAVLALGKSLSIPVLAEGVETREQLAILLQEGCDEIQGFLFGHPVPVAIATQPPISQAA